MLFVDTHAHLYLDDYKDDQPEMIRRSIEAGVPYMLIPHIDTRTSDDLQSLCNTWPANCFPMMGLHPTSVKENYPEEMAFVETKLTEGKYYAVGEVGIDLYWDQTYFKEQEICFRRQIELSLKYDLPLAIHTRNSIEETLAIVASFHGKGLRGVFHCFPGTIEQAEKAIELGFYLGLGGVLTYKNSEMGKVAAAISLDHIILETDAPFLTPVPKRGTRNESAYIPLIAEKIADFKGISLAEVAEKTTKNAMELFRFPVESKS
jgi:TatD DNase family protein